jgi:hypothetical protein
MRSAAQQLVINRKIVIYWREKMLYWLLRSEFDLKKDRMDELEMEGAFDAMSSMLEFLRKLHRELLDLGATEEEINHPGFFQPATYSKLPELAVPA